MQGLVRLFALLLLFLVPACTHEEEQPLSVGTQLWPGSEPLYLARDLDYLDDSLIHLVEYSALSESDRDFRNGMVDAVIVTLDMVLQLQEAGFEPRVVLVLDYSNGADAILARPEIRRLEDLRGKRVAVENLALSTYVLGRALEQEGLEPSDLQIVVIPVYQHMWAYESGQVDAVVTYEPFASKLVAAGAHAIFDSSQLPGEIVDVLVVREDALEKSRAQVQHLLQGWFRALRYLEEHPEDAIARMCPRLGTSPTEFAFMLEKLRLPSLEENRTLLQDPSSPLIRSAQGLLRFMQEEGLVHEKAQPELILDARSLEELRESQR